MRIALVSPTSEHSSSLALDLRDVGGVDVVETQAPDPLGVDQIVYQVANDPRCAFIPALVRRYGGVVVLHDWDLRELAFAAWPELRRGGLRGRVRGWREGPALNRSVVRFADAFLVDDEDLARRIRVDRNAPTPIGILRARDGERIAQEYVELLGGCPAPRSKRKSLLRTLVEASRQS